LSKIFAVPVRQVAFDQTTQRLRRSLAEVSLTIPLVAPNSGATKYSF